MSQGGDMNARFARMNVNAQPFIPNVGAQPFVPGVYPPYGYPAHGMSFFLLTCGLCCYRGKTPSSCLNIDSSLASHIPQRWMKGLVILQPTPQGTQL